MTSAARAGLALMLLVLPLLSVPASAATQASTNVGSWHWLVTPGDVERAFGPQSGSFASATAVQTYQTAGGYPVGHRLSIVLDDDGLASWTVTTGRLLGGTVFVPTLEVHCLSNGAGVLRDATTKATILPGDCSHKFTALRDTWTLQGSFESIRASTPGALPVQAEAAIAGEGSFVGWWG